MKKKFIYLLFFLLINCLISAQLREVIVPITDLKNEPITYPQQRITYPILSRQTPFQKTQLLFGEYIFTTGEEYQQNGENWIEVYATEQTKYNGLNLEYIKGWIKKKSTIQSNFKLKKELVIGKKFAQIFSTEGEPLIKLSIGTKLLFMNIIDVNLNFCFIKLPDGTKAKIKSDDTYYHINFDLKEKRCRNYILDLLPIFLGMPYSWGGRSAFANEYPGQTSIDCSGFINLAYRIIGLQIPRNAKDQYKYCNKIELGQDLLPGDLIFLANTNSTEKINHVLLYLNEYELQESIGSNEPYSNRIISFEERFGVERNKIISGEVYKNKVVYLGSLLNNRDKILKMRSFFLNYDY